MKTATSDFLLLAEPHASHRERVREIVEATGVFRPSEIGIALEVFDDAVAAPGEDYYALAAYDDDDRMVGFACFGETPGTEGTWDLYWIAVDPGGHRRGVGRRLLAACERQVAIRGGRLLVAQTSSRDDYRPTRAFYQAQDYVAAARVPGYYALDDDLVIYTKSLTPVERANV